MAGKRGLGKGIAALLPDSDSYGEAFAGGAVTGEKVPGGLENAGAGARKATEFFAPLSVVKANPNQPRKRFDPAELAELADSIRENGIIQPVIVEEAGDGSFTIIAGERRVRAAGMAGLAEIPVIVRNYSEEKAMTVALIENVQRADLNPVEEAAAYKRLMEFAGLSQDEAAARVGKNRSTVANALRLLRLPPDMQESLRSGEITAGHARALLAVLNPKAQVNLYREILDQGLSVRDAEKRASGLNNHVKKPKKDASSREKPRPELDAMEEKFLRRLGTRVKINGDLTKGAIIIDYYSMDDLERLYSIFIGAD